MALALRVFLAVCTGVLAGLSSAALLVVLDWSTATLFKTPSLIFGLPIAGALIGLSYARFGKEANGGTSLLLSRVEQPVGPIPFRMGPMIFLSTVGTHLFGGSAGREGTAVQMGGAFADVLAKPFKLDEEGRRILILSGMAAGFGAVFGTPWAGAIFAIEVSSRATPRYVAIIPCLVASFTGDFCCRQLGIHHATYELPINFSVSILSLAYTVGLGLVAALVSATFLSALDGLQALGKELPGAHYLRPMIGGLIVVTLLMLLGSRAYSGLGLPLIHQSFQPEGLSLGVFAMKMLFTLITLGAGFKGGEVTPLFCIGATLGSGLAVYFQLDPKMFAALGFVAIYAGASKLPLTCTIVGIELFGVEMAVPLGIVCALSVALSGKKSIYASTVE